MLWYCISESNLTTSEQACANHKIWEGVHFLLLTPILAQQRMAKGKRYPDTSCAISNGKLVTLIRPNAKHQRAQIAFLGSKAARDMSQPQQGCNVLTYNSHQSLGTTRNNHPLRNTNVPQCGILTHVIDTQNLSGLVYSLLGNSYQKNNPASCVALKHPELVLCLCVQYTKLYVW